MTTDSSKRPLVFQGHTQHLTEFATNMGSKRVQMHLWKDDKGKDLLRYDAGDPQATVTISRCSVDELESLGTAIGEAVTEMRRAPAPAAAGTTATTPPRAPRT
jgi:hypothetical protein